MKKTSKSTKKTAAPAATKVVAPLANPTAPKAEVQMSLFDGKAEPAKEEVKAAPAKAEPAKEEAKKEAAPKAEPAKKEEAAKKPAAKKETAPKKTTATKPAPAKKEVEPKAAATKEEAPKKTTTAKKAALVVSTVLELPHNAYTEADLVKITTDVWVYDLGKKAEDIKSVELYVKPAENRVYYVINKETAGSFQI